jgi:hypothetical protein
LWTRASSACSPVDRHRRHRANAARASVSRRELARIGLPHGFPDVFYLRGVQLEIGIQRLVDHYARVAASIRSSVGGASLSLRS